MTRVNFNPDAGGETVDADFFGGNYLFDRDQVGPDGTFETKVDALNINFIRYPGGTIAEKHFDLNDPDRTNAPESRQGVVTPLSDFIDFSVQNDHEYALVIPTIKYMQAVRNGEMTLQAATAELETFLTRLKRGDFGDQLPKTIEIGNEYYADREIDGVPQADSYGEIARAFADTVRDALGDEVRIAVQAGRFTAANDAILEHFDGAAGLVDDVIVHAYPWTIGDLGFHHDFRLGLASNWIDADLAEDVFLSEWNISNQYLDKNDDPIGADRIERGMAQSVAMLEMAYGYHLAGVGSAAVWPLQQNTPGDLGGDEGETSELRKLSDDKLTLAGEAFRLMSGAVVGLDAIEIENIDLDGANESSRFADEIYLQAYADASQVVVFASSWDLEPDQIGSELSFDLPGHFISATVTRLSSAAPDLLSPTGAPVLEEWTISPLARSADVSLVFNDAYEIYRIVYERLEGEFIVGDATSDGHSGGAEADRILGRAGDDTLLGGAGADTLMGNAAQDVLRGGAGDDLIIGGAGDDAIFGGTGEDELRGGRSDDALRGGGGADMIFGGAGDDVLRGGGGRDVLEGDGGRDELRGGGGADRLIADVGDDLLFGGRGADRFEFQIRDDSHVIGDFEVGVDFILIAGGDRSDLSVSVIGDDAVVDAGALTILVEDGAANLFTTDDILFL